jgi:uncharacterized protein YidB (DUF937 family)
LAVAHIQEEEMGLLDILNGLQNGPSGQRQPSRIDRGSAGAGGMSPIMMALLGLLAYKALKGSGSQPAAPGSTPFPPGGTVTAGHPGGGIGDILGGLLGGKLGSAPATNAPGGTVTAGRPGGGIGDILGGLLGGRPGSAPATNAGTRPGGSLNDLLPGGLGGLLGGAAAGTVLSGGLGNLIKQLQNSGQGRVAQSWIGTGPNHEIAPDDLAAALGADTLDALTEHTGLGRKDMLAGLSQYLPDLIDQLTPNGRLPTEDEASRWI